MTEEELDRLMVEEAKKEAYIKALEMRISLLEETVATLEGKIRNLEDKLKATNLGLGGIFE